MLQYSHVAIVAVFIFINWGGRGSVSCGWGWGTWPERAEELVCVVVAGVASRL